jgi:hypothetical protein
MNYSRITAACIAASILLLPACGPQYKPRALKPLSQKTVQYEETKNDITVRANPIPKAELNEIFGGQGANLAHAPIVPIQISIQNNSNNTLTFDPRKSTIAFADHQLVASYLQHSTFLKGSSIIVLGLIAAGAVYTFTFPFMVAWAFFGSYFYLMATGMAAMTGILVLTPAVSIFYVKKAAVTNHKIEHDVKSKTISEITNIGPNEELDAILFADKKSFKNNFEITLENEETREEIPFTVDFNK